MSLLKYEFDLSEDFQIIKNEFFQYNPKTDFTVEKNVLYLQEDLLQIKYAKEDITVDLGWYGDTTTNKGVFKLYLIQAIDWENPVLELLSNSSEEIHFKLVEVLNYLGE
ncbi:MAG: hypothetical protein KJ941_11635 [Bacteroidetes bacterium]|nr:hypothetical protein [Bacteroidota bacterium]